MARKQWRCFFCDEVFTRAKDAAEHFGVDEACEADVPACKIAAHEGHLVKYIRKLEALQSAILPVQLVPLAVGHRHKRRRPDL